MRVQKVECELSNRVPSVDGNCQTTPTTCCSALERNISINHDLLICGRIHLSYCMFRMHVPCRVSLHQLGYGGAAEVKNAYPGYIRKPQNNI